MLFLPQVGSFVEKGSYGLEIVPITSYIKKKMFILGYIVKCNLAFEESFYSIHFANTTQFTSSMVLVIKPSVLHAVFFTTKCSKGYFYSREIMFLHPLFGIFLKES